MAKRKLRRSWARFTISDVSDAVGRSPRRVQADARAGLVDPADVRSLARYVVGLAPLSDVARQHYLALGVALGVADVPGTPARHGKESLNSQTVGTGSGGGGDFSHT
jgi:hypothetical protein